ncbi:hypothetical protein [Herbaspirillum camelliae]|uniref:hypothetical protein n=1 Tax=Herbaspirillum camelliae TaxID=1892903 RepID=UPI00094A13C4|nr:hypothetical protein [Herbaspirillum camelliae]
MTKDKSENYSADLTKFLEKSEGNRPMVYLDRNGHPTIGIGTLLYKKGLVQEKAVDIVAKESSDPELFKKVMTAIVKTKGDEKELEKLFLMGKEGGNRTLLKLRQQDSQGEVVETDVSKLLPKSAALRVMEVASPQYEDRVKKIEKFLSAPEKEFSFPDRQRIAVFSRIYNATPKDDFWTALKSADLDRIAEFFSAGRGGEGNTGHYKRTIEEMAMFTGKPLVKRGDATGILGADSEGNQMFVGFRSLGKVPAHQDAAEIVAFSIKENSDGTRIQAQIKIDLPKKMRRATDFVDQQTVDYNAVLDSQRKKSQHDSLKMSDDSERGSARNDVSANSPMPADEGESHHISPPKAKLKR